MSKPKKPKKKSKTRTKYVSPPVTEEQKALFEAIRNPEHNNFAVLSGKFKKADVAYIVAVIESKDFLIKPVAILVDESFLAKFGDDMQDPHGDAPKETRT